MFDIAIIGAGVVGGMVARTLSKYNLKICILERESDVAMGATRANSAIVHAGFDAKDGSLKACLNVEGSKMMEQVCGELGVKYKRNGSLVIGFDDEDRATIEELYRRGVTNGVEELAVLSGDQVRNIEPNISQNVTCALFAPTGAIVCPYELAMAAIGNAMDNGAELFCNFSVCEISRENGIYTIKDKGGKAVEAMYVINAAGLYSDYIASLVEDNSFSIKPRRGEYILLDKECGSLVSHTIFRTPSKMGKGILVSPTVDGNLLTGPTSVDIDDKEDKSTAAEGFNLIFKQSAENVDGISFGKSITSFCGLRAVGSTGDFIINSPCDNFINLAGIESPGLSASPAIAKLVAEMLVDMGLFAEERQNYIATRSAMHGFFDLPIEEKNEIIKKDASFGRIICRCESITEGEILRAIRTNPKPHDLDGVKRRTRAQMGRCQGGFCSPYIMELLSRELSLPYEEVTKSGGGSRLLIDKTKGGESCD